MNHQNHHEEKLLEALLQESNRNDREKEIQLIEAALTNSAQSNSKRKRRWPWATGLAASAILTTGLVYQNMSPKYDNTDISISYQPEPRIQAHSSNHIQESIVEEKQYRIRERNAEYPNIVPASPLVTHDHKHAAKVELPARAGAKLASETNRGVNEEHISIAPSPMPMKPEAPNNSGDRYGSLVDPEWKDSNKNPLSTFSVDVDNASYSNVRRMIEEGRSIHPDAVRIEEFINAFDYGYAAPMNDEAFAVHQSIATCPWNEKHALLRIGIKGREMSQEQRPASNLVFLIDVSGSMQSADKLALVKQSLKLLLGKLDERDSVAYVVYAGSEGVALPPTTLDENGKQKAINALNALESGGSTNGGASIKRAYQIAAEQFRKGGVNRVILCSDGDFNVGVTGTTELVSLVKERAAANIYLSVLSFGTGNLNDEMLEAIAKDGNGNHYYVDSIKEARRVFLQKLSGTLVTIAKDVKLQLEFNPARVASYRLVGYANRQLRNEDFENDRVDAGDIGAGHEVTAFYEIVPAGGTVPGQAPALKYQRREQVQQPAAPATLEDEWLTTKLRHKHPEGDKSALQEHILRGEVQSLQNIDNDFRFAAAVAMFGMKLRIDENLQNVTWQNISQLAADGLGANPDETRAEFLDLLRKVSK